MRWLRCSVSIPGLIGHKRKTRDMLSSTTRAVCWFLLNFRWDNARIFRLSRGLYALAVVPHREQKPPYRTIAWPSFAAHKSIRAATARRKVRGTWQYNRMRQTACVIDAMMQTRDLWAGCRNVSIQFFYFEELLQNKEGTVPFFLPARWGWSEAWEGRNAKRVPKSKPTTSPELRQWTLLHQLPRHPNDAAHACIYAGYTADTSAVWVQCNSLMRTWVYSDTDKCPFDVFNTKRTPWKLRVDK